MRQESSQLSKKTPAWLDRELFPFRSRFLNVDGCEVHYIDEGQGQPLLLLHGNPTWSFLYRTIVKELRGRFRCIALDYPGFGLSTPSTGYDFRPASHAKIVQGFVEKLGLNNLLLMVQDWGGPIGLTVATQEPYRVSGLIIGNTWAWPVDGDAHFERFSKLIGGPVGHFLIRNFNAFVNFLIPAGTTKSKLSKSEMNSYRMPFANRDLREPTYIFPREILGSKDFLADLERQLPKLRNLPVLILWGDKDFAFREKERRRFEALFPNNKLVVLKGAGHFIQEDAPLEIAAAIKNWREK